MVPEPHPLRMHSETFRLGNHPSRHRKERDDAALLTQEGSMPRFMDFVILGNPSCTSGEKIADDVDGFWFFQMHEMSCSRQYTDVCLRNVLLP